MSIQNTSSCAWCNPFLVSSRQVLKKHGWYDGKYSISLVDDKLALPLTEQGRQQIQDLCQTDRYFTIDDLEFHIQSVVLKPSRRHCVKTKPERLLELSKQHVCGVGTEWSFTLQEEVPRSWEVHGNTALLPHNAYISHMWNHQGMKQFLTKLKYYNLQIRKEDLFIGPQEFVVGYSKAPEQPQSSARPICHSHAMTRTGREPATIRIAA